MLSRCRVIEYLYGDNMHGELIKRCGQVPFAALCCVVPRVASRSLLRRKIPQFLTLQKMVRRCVYRFFHAFSRARARVLIRVAWFAAL